MDKWITEDKIALLEADMQKLVAELREARDMDETTFSFIQHVRGSLTTIQGLHTTLAGWELLLEAIWGKNR